MCGRYTLKKDKKAYDEYVRQLGFTEISENPRALPFRYNIAPTQAVPVLRCDGDQEAAVFEELLWGLIPSWAKDSKIGHSLINARSETVFEKPAFRTAARRRRCLILADGFYEWLREGKSKRPFYFRPRSDELFAFAGIYESWRPPSGEPIRSCSIVTCAANSVVAPIHDRMPVLLSPAAARKWADPRNSDPETLAPLLVPFDADSLVGFEVGSAVSSARSSGPDLVTPIG